MLITKDTPRVKGAGIPVSFKWQTGHYAPIQDHRHSLPPAFLLLCRLWEVTPANLINDMMDNLAAGSWKREGRDEAKKHLQDYILAMGYGQQQYTVEDIRSMFAQLDAIGMLWPGETNEKMMDRHVKWRDKYYNWWFKKWWRKYRRK